MNTTRPLVRAACAHTSPITNSTLDAEREALDGWDDDIVRAARASARKRGLGADHALADDVAQEVRLAVALAVRKRGVNDERYLRRVISNTTKNAARQSQVMANEVPDEALEELPADFEPVDVFAARRVRGWIGDQPPQLQAVFRLLYCDDLSQREAATRLGVSQPRVAKLHRQLLERGEADLQDLAA